MSSTLWTGGAEPAPVLAAHQSEAVWWIAERLRRYEGVLLADDVGLGKSWVAAAVVRALGLQVAELIVPAALREMWREVGSRFAIDLEVITHEAIRRRDPAPTACGLVIVDEAHRFRNPARKGWRRLALRLGPARGLFLTATPIWNTPADLLALLRLLVADDAFRAGGVASIEAGIAEPRLRSRILDHAVLRRRHEILGNGSDLGEMTGRIVWWSVPESWREIESTIAALEFPHCLGPSRAILATMMVRRLHSGPAALRASVARQLSFCRSGIDLLHRGFRLDRREFTRMLVVESGVQELLFPQMFLEPDDEPDLETLRREITRLERIHGILEDLVDPKLDRLQGLLAEHPAPTLIFVGAVETARACFTRLRRLQRVAVATGSFCRSPSGARSIEAIVEDFRAGCVEILITTDLGGEGLNLQRAERVIHYDLPWSPRRIDQRNGRARRMGREGRRLEVVELRPTDRDTPSLEAIERKEKIARAFWDIDPASPVQDPSLHRLPSHLPSSHPQVRVWRRLPAGTPRNALLHRMRAGHEIRLIEQIGRPTDRD